MQSCQNISQSIPEIHTLNPSKPSEATNLDSDLVEVGSNDRTDDKHRDLEGPEHQTKVPHLQPFADGFSWEEWRLKIFVLFIHCQFVTFMYKKRECLRSIQN